MPGDFYPTVDTRCVDGLLHHFDLRKERIVDICAPQGSSIVDYLRALKYNAFPRDNAFEKNVHGTWIVTNTPYTLPLVDEILRHSVRRVISGEVLGFAGLYRKHFDSASTRADVFENCMRYYAEITLRFRPWWRESREKQPFHNFVWHVWTAERVTHARKLWYTPPYDPKYATKKARQS